MSLVRRPFLAAAAGVAATVLAAAVLGGLLVRTSAAEEEEEGDPPEVVLGERLFLETRFAQHFFAASGGDVNARNVPRDPVMDRAITPDGSLRGAFRGDSMNCRACHLVDEHGSRRGGGVRAYADFARRSPVPGRGDGLTETLRNSPSLVGASKRRPGGAPLLHFDGEFASPEDLVVGTFTGRNFGWLADERDAAVRHVARVLRRDDGQGALAREFGGIGYARALEGTSASIPSEFRLPPGLRTDVGRATDEQLVRAAARIVGAYLRSLDFARDENGFHAGSAYDAFIRKNRLPRAPRGGEPAQRYAARLRDALERLREPAFVDQRDGDLALHGRQDFVFRPRELRGLRVFLTRPEDAPGAVSGVGNCVACHAPPEFSDFRFHATGVSQLEYDRVHGDGSFAELAIPALADRNARRDDFLPPVPGHAAATGTFASVPDSARPGRADLGLWNVLFDPVRPLPQARLRRHLTAQAGAPPDDATLLARTVGAFKTPTLRDLGQSGPYLHDGSADGLGDVLSVYVRVASLARAGQLRNADPALAGIRLDDRDIGDLAAFLESLDEDYE